MKAKLSCRMPASLLQAAVRTVGADIMSSPRNRDMSVICGQIVSAPVKVIPLTPRRGVKFPAGEHHPQRRNSPCPPPNLLARAANSLRPSRSPRTVSSRPQAARISRRASLEHRCP